ncbi:hypothetical protein ASPVEDRAFT_43654 [Aspergillus versicolor CBS 583.65]|uniref:Uncharacterized protein n=1 Tax=Aspergillus versicolor CBS 583.65 TaxID=1036611 RepID=A0A1L9PRT9_ASPVE|nr:uncharacterized protein ASPVEDRAFT_43654 [Aspergillus versicolor CBS 583.65]OJJ04191.1 hypothetical protein ASPVEDRAFT_43654 [Aspergillus versicolor CBS 583.65]
MLQKAPRLPSCLVLTGSVNAVVISPFPPAAVTGCSRSIGAASNTVSFLRLDSEPSLFFSSPVHAVPIRTRIHHIC